MGDEKNKESKSKRVVRAVIKQRDRSRTKDKEGRRRVMIERVSPEKEAMGVVIDRIERDFLDELHQPLFVVGDFSQVLLELAAGYKDERLLCFSHGASPVASWLSMTS